MTLGPHSVTDRRPVMVAALFALLLHRTQSGMKALARQVALGAVPPEVFSGRAEEFLLASHETAAFYGRQWAIDGQPFGEWDKKAGESAMALQRPFLGRFVRDLQRDRYTIGDGGNLGAIVARAVLYAGAIRGTANVAWAAMLGPQATIYWVLGADEDHCSDCPRYAENSPYTLDTLPAFPGDGHSECLGNCRCHLSTHDGRTGPHDSHA